jgi:short subunit dehydrogenase-like uncharacterized protein
VRAMIDAHHEQARASGARIVHCCGFDSIPADLGTLLLQTELRARTGAPAPRVVARYGAMRGGTSGGTLASGLGMLEAAATDPAVRALLADPYALVPGGSGPDRGETRTPGYDRERGQLTAPFVMAAINARIVRRSNALSGHAYGHDFSYDEVMTLPLSAKGAAIAAGTALGLAVLPWLTRSAWVRDRLARRVPAPGTGPSTEQRARGHWELTLTAAAAPIAVVVADDHGDPGYASTSRMLGESALCLAQDDLGSSGGVLTPAVAMGAPLINRLRRVGLRFDVLPLASRVG